MKILQITSDNKVHKPILHSTCVVTVSHAYITSKGKDSQDQESVERAQKYISMHSRPLRYVEVRSQLHALTDLLPRKEP
jgi:hypothetical protein